MKQVGRVIVVIVVLALAQLGVVQAGSISFGGGATGWDVNIIYCTNGFRVAASGGATGAGIASSVVVTAATIATKGLPGQVAGGTGTGAGVPVISGTATFFFVNYQPVGTSVTTTISRQDNGGDIAGSPQTDTGTVGACTVGGGNDQWFNPGDSRISGAAGDRVAVYCNTNTTGNFAGTIDVWGMDGNGKGQRLTTFNYRDIVAAGSAGIMRSLGGMGNVFIVVDASGKYFYTGWIGGPYNATGIGDFTKSFVCSFPAS
ncbi:MAG: hypothetical protein IT324_08565 [Anaerolineae bacterium]|nr:hypothetical protein [Anaerolineae bacterium]